MRDFGQKEPSETTEKVRWVNGDVSQWPIFACKNGPLRNVPIDPLAQPTIDQNVIAEG